MLFSHPPSPLLLLPPPPCDYHRSAWKRNAKSDHDDDSASESGHGGELPKPGSRADLAPPGGSVPQPASGQQSPSMSSSGGSSSSKAAKPRMSFRAAGQATLSLLSARKRLEDGLKNLGKRRSSKRESVDEGTRACMLQTCACRPLPPPTQVSECGALFISPPE